MSDDVRLEGRLGVADFGGSAVTLVTDGGEQFELRGVSRPGWVGRRVRVRGRRAAAQFGFAMVGAVVEVVEIELVG